MCLSLDICWITYASGRLWNTAKAIFYISPTLNQTRCCADPPPTLKCNLHCVMEPCYTFLVSYCSFTFSALHDYTMFFIPSLSRATGLTRAVVLWLWLNQKADLLHSAWCSPAILGMQYSQIWTLENISIPVQMNTVSWFLSHLLLVLTSSVFPRNKSLIWWLQTLPLLPIGAVTFKSI